VAKKPLDDDASLWSRVAASVTPILRRRVSVASPVAKPAQDENKPKKTKSTRRKVEPTARSAHPAVAPEIKPADLNTIGFGGISRSSARAIKSGQAGYTSKLDLHGLSRAKAHSRLVRYLNEAATSGHRHVLIITGKGAAGGGVIRQEFPEWINSPPLNMLVIAYCQAQPKDGGAGAFYVNLRRS